MNRLPVIALLASPFAFGGEPVALNQDEFKMYRHFTQAMDDPRVQKLKPEQQHAAIAKDAHYKLKDMDAAIAKAEAAGDFKSKCEANIKDAVGATDLKGRLGKVEVDITEPHAVAYVQWLNEAPDKLALEATL